MFRTRQTFYWALLALAIVCVVPLYWPSLSYDLYQDDYLLLRPWRPERLLSVLFGPWVGPEYTEFYRPVTIYSYKAMVYLFGLNTRALHVLPLVTIISVAWLVGVFVWRETGARAAAVTGTVLASVHPAVTLAAGPFLSNQYQGWIAGWLLIALIGWQNCRNHGWRSWQALWVPCVLAALMKESGLMLPLMLVALHLARRWWLRDIAPLPRAVLIAAVGLFTALNGVRFLALGGFGGYGGLVGPKAMLVNLLKAPFYTLVRPHAAPPWSWAFAAVSLLLCSVGVWTLWKRRERPESRLVLAGLVILCVAAIPTTQIMSADRASPHQIGAILMLTGGAWALARLLRFRVLVAATAAAALLATVTVTADAVDAYNPCNGNLLNDTESYEASIAPPEMKRWHKSRPRPCNPDTHVPFYRSTSRITWGVREEVIGPNNVLHHWTMHRVIAFIDKRATSAVVSVRHLNASADEPIHVEVRTNRGPAAKIELDSPAWHTVQVPLVPNWNVWFRQMHRMELIADARYVPGLIMRPVDVVY